MVVGLVLLHVPYRIMRPQFLLLFVVVMNPWVTLNSVVTSRSHLFCHSFALVAPFSTLSTKESESKLFLAAGMGMGGTTQLKAKKKGKKKKTASSSLNTPFDVNASLLRLEKRYDELCLADAKELQVELESDYQTQDTRMLKEYIIGVRAADAKKRSAVSDWLPVAQLCISQSTDRIQHDTFHDSMDAAVSYYCRELCHAASRGVKVLKSVPRNQIEYSAEPLSSFHKFVYEPIVEGTNDDNDNDQVMTKTKARSVLNLDENADLDTVKKSYRTMSFELHPDRLSLNKNLDDQELENASKQYHDVKLAYETLLSGGIRNISNGEQSPLSSWYQTLGGRARTDFYGPILLMPRESAQNWIEKNGIEVAVAGLDPEVATPFLLRNQL